MLEFSNVIRIRRPIAEVFAYLLDLEHLPEWNCCILEVTKLSSGPVGIATVFHQVRTMDQQDLVIAELIPLNRIVVRSLHPRSLDLEMTFTFREDRDGTLLQESCILDSGVPASMESFGAGRMKAAMADDLKHLQELMEERRAVLQHR